MQPKNVLITGASSGIGAALALHYSKPGVLIAITGRDYGRLHEITKQCQDRGAEVIMASIDVTHKEAMQEWINEVNEQHSLELVIANAGISNAGEDRGENFDRKIFEVNLDGVLNTIHPAIKIMQQAGGGQIAIMSSLASMISAPRAPAYCASKSALRVYGEALRNSLRKFNIKVSVICPGFVKTPLTDRNKYHMPFMMSVDKAACLSAKGLAKNHGLITYPKRMYFLLWLLRVLPHRLQEMVFSYL
ncbi:MAG: SDR family NAD(P)-dependent oxidoreductase [Gammaproteobacteria bacterium]|nr:SDR family NAD(P)-dependent oxidoreductase [Gammaproteobacteria bacterium]